MHVLVTNVSRSYGATKALDDVSLDIAPGQVVALLGLNGAGKTTLFRCLSTLVVPDKGEISYAGETLTRQRLDLRKRFLFMPDFPFLFGSMTVIQHMGMVLRLYDADHIGVETRVLEVLRELDLLPLVDSKLEKLSRGQVYKAALAPLIVLNPDLWILDEPFASGMDPNGITYFKRCAREAALSGKTILYSTQILDVVEAFSDRVCVIDKGRIRLSETMDGLRAQMNRESGMLEEIFSQMRER